MKLRRLCALILSGLLTAGCIAPACAEQPGDEASPHVSASEQTGEQADDTECEHIWTQKTIAATCTEEGLVTRTCSKCRATEPVETIPMKDHKYNSFSTVKATEDTDGYRRYHCSVCYREKIEILPRLSSTSGVAPTQPTTPTTPAVPLNQTIQTETPVMCRASIFGGRNPQRQPAPKWD